jgi:hypothetical protein
VISLLAVKKWIPVFNGKRIKLVDLPKSGRPRDTGAFDVARALIEGEGQISQKKIA